MNQKPKNGRLASVTFGWPVMVCRPYIVRLAIDAWCLSHSSAFWRWKTMFVFLPHREPQRETSQRGRTYAFTCGMNRRNSNEMHMRVLGAVSGARVRVMRATHLNRYSRP